MESMQLLQAVRVSVNEIIGQLLIVVRNPSHLVLEFLVLLVEVLVLCLDILHFSQQDVYLLLLILNLLSLLMHQLLLHELFLDHLIKSMLDLVILRQDSKGKLLQELQLLLNILLHVVAVRLLAEQVTH